MKELSIITVCLNNKEGLQKTIDSVKSQVFLNYELIVIDGGSTDGSLSIIEENKEFVTYWVSEKDKGIYHAMNKGIEKATGKYCLFLNSGDYLAHKEVLDIIFNTEQEHDILYGNILKVKGRKKRIVTYSSELSFWDFYKKEPGIHHQAAFIKRELFLKYGFYREDTYLIADWIFFYTVIVLNHASTKYLNKMIAVCDANGLSNQPNLSIKPQVVKDMEIKSHLIKMSLPLLAIKDYELKKKKRNVLQIIKVKLLWRTSVFFPLKLYVCK